MLKITISPRKKKKETKFNSLQLAMTEKKNG